MPVTISVSGTSQIYRSPERATLRINISHSGESKDQVMNQVTTTSSQLVSCIQTFSLDKNQPVEDESVNDKPITKWTSGSLRTWSHQEWNKETEKNDILVHNASVKLEATFKDFKKFSDMALEFSLKPHVEVSSIHWDLTTKTRMSLTESCRKLAVDDAKLKAKHYAEAIGLSNMECTEISDPEAKSASSSSPMFRAPMMRTAMAADMGGQGLEFSPEDIEIITRVHAKFVAS